MLPRPVDRAEAFLVEAGHTPLHAAAMALSLLPDASVSAQVRQQVRPYRHLKMTSQERDQFARTLLSRRVLAEGMLLTLQGEDVRDSAVVSAHKLCEARVANRKLSLQIGGGKASRQSIGQARSRLVDEIGELDALIEAATASTDAADLSMDKAGAKANPRVVHLQNRLNTLGHRVLPDGVFGPMTDEAVKDFQTNAGLPASGVVDSLTADSLRRGGQIKVDAAPGLVPGQQAPSVGQDDGSNKETGNSAQQDQAPEKAQQPAEKSEGDSTANQEKSDAKKTDSSTTKQGGKSVSVNVKLSESIGPIKKGAFHAWLGKDPDEPITDADIARGIAAGGHPARMARFAKASRGFSHKKKDVQEGMCQCGAPDIGHGVCQRGHRIEEADKHGFSFKRIPGADGHEVHKNGHHLGKVIRTGDMSGWVARPKSGGKIGPKTGGEYVHKTRGDAAQALGDASSLGEAWSDAARAASILARRKKKPGATLEDQEHTFANTMDDRSKNDKKVSDYLMTKGSHHSEEKMDIASHTGVGHAHLDDMVKRGKLTVRSQPGFDGDPVLVLNRAKNVPGPHPSMHAPKLGDDFESAEYRAANPPSVPFGSHNFPKSGATMQSMSGGSLPTTHMYGPHHHMMTEADSKGDYPKGQMKGDMPKVCPECGAPVKKSGVCQRGHSVKRLMEATFSQMRQEGLL